MHIRKQTGAHRYYAVNRKFYHSMVKHVTPPSVKVKTQGQPAFLDLHTDFPEGYGRYRSLTFLQSILEHETHLRPQPSVTPLVP